MRINCLKFAIILTSLLYALPAVSHQWKEFRTYRYLDTQDYSVTYWEKIINVDNFIRFDKMEKLPNEVKEFLKNKKIAYMILDNKLECPSGKVTLSQIFYVDKNNNDLLQVIYGEVPILRIFTTPIEGSIKFEMKEALPNPQAKYHINDGDKTYCQFVMEKLGDKK